MCLIVTDIMIAPVICSLVHCIWQMTAIESIDVSCIIYDSRGGCVVYVDVVVVYALECPLNRCQVQIIRMLLQAIIPLIDVCATCLFCCVCHYVADVQLALYVWSLCMCVGHSNSQPPAYDSSVTPHSHHNGNGSSTNTHLSHAHTPNPPTPPPIPKTAIPPIPQSFSELSGMSEAQLQRLLTDNVALEVSSSREDVLCVMVISV